MGHLAATGTKVWKDMAPRAVEWLQNAHDCKSLEKPRAIEDIKDTLEHAIQDAPGDVANEDKSDEQEHVAGEDKSDHEEEGLGTEELS